MSLPVTAAEVIKTVRGKNASIKNAVYSSKYSNKKQLMAVVCQVLKYYEVLNEILDQCSLKSSDKRFKKSPELAIVVLHRHLLGKGLNGCYTEYKKTIESQKSAIHTAEVRVKLKRKIMNLSEAVREDRHQLALPKYARVNTILGTLEDVTSQLASEGYKLADVVDLELKEKWVAIDTDINNLLVFPTDTDLHASELVTSGKLIIQDKASCVPPQVLNPPAASHVIDACAAPGNKTSQLAAILQNSGSITAFELNSKRCVTLKEMLAKAKVTCCQAVNADFTRCDVSKYPEVEYILVDPSCSGSGIISRKNELIDDEHSTSEERLRKLSSFQSVILKKALSFPNVKRVVYSTCSIHNIENEMVVKDVIEQFSQQFTLEKVLPNWTNRGHDLDGTFPQGTNCIRSSPEVNRTIGFFVASFIRRK